MRSRARRDGAVAELVRVELIELGKGVENNALVVWSDGRDDRIALQVEGHCRGAAAQRALGHQQGNEGRRWPKKVASG